MFGKPTSICQAQFPGFSRMVLFTDAVLFSACAREQNSGCKRQTSNLSSLACESKLEAPEHEDHVIDWLSDDSCGRLGAAANVRVGGCPCKQTSADDGAELRRGIARREVHQP